MPPLHAAQNDWIDNYFSYGVDPRRRRVMLHGDVGEETTDLAVSALLLLDSQSAEPIEVWISTFGGGSYEMFGLHDVIRSLRSRVVSVSHGKIMSAGVLVARAADEALCMPNTWFMTHEGSWGDEFKGHSHIKDDLAHMEEMERCWAKLLGQRTSLPAAAWMKMSSTGRDRYFDAKQAIEWGLMDGIYSPNAGS